MTRIKDPKQVASTIRQILLILMRSSNVCFMAGQGETEGRRDGGTEPRTAGLCVMLMPPASVSLRSQRCSLECTNVTFLRPHTRLQRRNSAPLAAQWMSAPTLWKCFHLYLITASLFPFDLSRYPFSHFGSLFKSFQSRLYNFYICNWIQRGQKVHFKVL